MADEELGSGSITITLDSSSAEAAAQRLADRLEEILDQAGRDAGRRIARSLNRAIRDISPLRVRVEADLRPFGHSIDTLANLDAVQVRVTPDMTGFLNAIRAHVAGVEIPINVVPDFDGFDAAIRAHNAPDVTVNLNVNRRSIDAATASVGRLSRVLAGLGGSLGGVALLGGLVNDIQDLSGAAAALPAVITAGAAAFGTLALALSGVGEAFGAALTEDAEKFEKALDGLSPAAQAAAKEVRALKPGFDALRESVQAAFFEQLERDFTRLGKALAPLKSRVEDLAGAFGGIASEAVGAATTSTFIDSIRSSFDALIPAVQALQGFVRPLAQAFAEMSQGVTEAFGSRLTGAIEGASQRFAEFVRTADLGASAVDWVSNAGAVLRSLGDIAENVSGIFSGLFGAAESAGVESFTGVLGELLGVLNEFVNSGPVQAALQALFQAFAAFVPVIGAAATAFGTVLGPALQAVAEAVLPVVQALSSALLPVFETLADVGGTIVTALSPLVSVLGSTLASVIGAAAPLLQTLATLFADVAEAVAPLIEQITSALIPVFDALAPAVTQIVTAITPLVEQLVAALLPILPPIVDGFIAILNALLPVIPLVAELVTALAPLVSLLISGLEPIIQFAAEVIKWTAIEIVVPIINGLIAVITDIIGAVDAVISAIGPFVEAVIGFFSNLRSNVSGVVSGLVSAVKGFFLNMVATVTGNVSSLVSRVVGFFQSLPGRAAGALSGLAGAIGGVIRGATNAAIGVITGFVGRAVSFLGSLPGKARAALSGAASALVSVGRNMILGLINGIKSAAGAVASAAKNVVSGAISAAKSVLKIGSPSKLFKQFGKWVGEGFVIGLTGSESDIKNAADKMVGKLIEAFKGVKSQTDDVLVAQLRKAERSLIRLARQREAIADRIKKANEFALQVTQAARQAFSLAGIAEERGVGVTGLVKGLDAAVKKVRDFTDNLNVLAKRGVSKSIISQIIGLGPEAGAALAEELAQASSGQLAALNDAQKQLDKATKKLGQDSADILFDAGKKAGEGFLAGLKGQKKAIEDLMLDIAKGMQAAIKKALKIKSPSRVFAQIGRFVGAGLAGGIDASAAGVRNSATRLAGATLDPFGTSPRFSLSQPVSGASVASSGGATGRAGLATVQQTRTVNNYFTVNTVGDPEVTANRIAARLATAGGGL